jgi:DNA-binding transcriptional LysR family regulator
MRPMHSPGRVNLDLLRAFLIVVESGSLNKAAERLRLAQSTLTRQMRALEHEIGGPLFERSPAGVALTATGHLLVKEVPAVLGEFDALLSSARRLARGQSATLRVGYLMSAAADYLHPALAALRRAHPDVKVKLLDLSPGEQLAALSRGEIDMALIGHPGTLVSCEFYVRRLDSLPVMVAMSEYHALADQRTIEVAALKNELFVGAAESDLPGYNRWLVQVCRRARFRPRIVSNAASLTEGLGTVVTDAAVSLLPAYAAKTPAPGVVYRPLRDTSVTWDLLVAWQRGKLSDPVKAMLAALPG